MNHMVRIGKWPWMTLCFCNQEVHFEYCNIKVLIFSMSCKKNRNSGVFEYYKLTYFALAKSAFFLNAKKKILLYLERSLQGCNKKKYHLLWQHWKYPDIGNLLPQLLRFQLKCWKIQSQVWRSKCLKVKNLSKFKKTTFLFLWKKLFKW